MTKAVSMNNKEKKVLTALAIGLSAFMTLSSVNAVSATELIDNSERVEQQVAYEKTDDINSIILNEINAPNKVFVGWTDSLEKGGRIYEAGEEIDISDNITLYPVWEEITFDVMQDEFDIDIASGEDKTLKKIEATVGEEGLDITSENMGLKVSSNDNIETRITFSDITVDKDVEAEGDCIYPILENENEKVNVLLTYEIDAIKDGRIIGKSEVSIPVVMKADSSLFEKEEKGQPTVVTIDEFGNAETGNFTEDTSFDYIEDSFEEDFSEFTEY